MSVILKAKTKRREIEIVLSGEQTNLIHYLDTPEIKYPFGCCSASCGVCRGQVVEGIKLLEELGETEKDTLDRCKADSNCRLMCRARVKDGVQGVIKVVAVDD